MKAGLLDFHCHLDLYPDPAGVVAECERADVRTLAVTTTPRAWARNREFAAASRRVRPALGLHPQLVAERAGELTVFEELLPGARYVGEVGLDAGPRFFKSLELQKLVFARILKCCARLGGRILSIHSVRAARDVLDLVEEHLPPSNGKVVLHWFTGSMSEARRATDLGCYFSINAEMLRNNRHRKLVSALPADRLLTETDGPFTRLGDAPFQPSDVRIALDSLASLRGVAPEVLASTVLENLRTLVSEWDALP